MSEDRQQAEFEPTFRVVHGQTDQWEVLNQHFTVCGRVRRDRRGRFSIARDLWDDRWKNGFSSRRDAADVLIMIQREVECIRAEYGR